MTVQSLFATPLIVEKTGVDLAELKAIILKKKGEDAGIIVSNFGGWHSDYKLFEWGGDVARALGSEIAKLASAHTESSGKLTNWGVEGWANVMEAGSVHAVHAHPGNFWSAVLCVEADGEGGELILHDPRMPGLAMHAPALRLKGQPTEQAAKIKPKPGTLLMFPAWLNHSVLPWRGPGRRISIAVNLAARGR
jgi:uncharacterized protein (TIGR02466 family)